MMTAWSQLFQFQSSTGTTVPRHERRDMTPLASAAGAQWKLGKRGGAGPLPVCKCPEAALPWGPSPPHLHVLHHTDFIHNLTGKPLKGNALN